MLSVIIPVYKAEKGIERCLCSVLGQTWSDLEVIVVDNGSSDQSAQICKSFARKDHRVRVLSQINRGAFLARLTGIEHARGEWITFADSDDWVEDTMYEDLMRPFLTEKHTDICIGGYVIEKPDHQVRYIPRWEKERVYSAREAREDILQAKFMWWTLWDKIYRRSLFYNIYPLISTGDFGEDLELNWKLFRNARQVHYMPLCKYHYCENAESLTRKAFNLNALNVFPRLEAIFEEAEDADHRLKELVSQRITDQAKIQLLRMVARGEPQFEEPIRYCKGLYYKYRPYVPRDENEDDPVLREIVEAPSEEAHRHIAALRTDYARLKPRFIQEWIAFTQDCAHVFIYGTGQVADRLTELAEENNLPYDGYAVTNAPDPAHATYRGKPVREFHALHEAYGAACGFILGLGKKNAREVSGLLDAQGATQAKRLYEIFYSLWDIENKFKLFMVEL